MLDGLGATAVSGQEVVLPGTQSALVVAQQEIARKADKDAGTTSLWAVAIGLIALAAVAIVAMYKLDNAIGIVGGCIGVIGAIVGLYVGARMASGSQAPSRDQAEATALIASVFAAYMAPDHAAEAVEQAQALLWPPPVATGEGAMAAQDAAETGGGPPTN
jgi:hypothetical protein